MQIIQKCVTQICIINNLFLFLYSYDCLLDVHILYLVVRCALVFFMKSALFHPNLRKMAVFCGFYGVLGLKNIKKWRISAVFSDFFGVFTEKP